MLRSTGFIVAAMAIGIAVLSALGVWQLHRLAWKEALIARIESRIEQPPGTIGDLSRLWRETGDVAYVPTRVTGTFLHDGEMLFYTTYKGAVGWDVLTPMRLADGTILIVDRGFVPIDRADPATRGEGRPDGMVEIAGLARNPVNEKPNRFMPDNDPGKRQFYWKDIAALSRLAAASAKPADAGGESPVLPFLLDQSAPENPGGLPRVGTTIIAFPNNHLQYALTWFGLALALLGVGSYFLYARRQMADRAARENG